MSKRNYAALPHDYLEEMGILTDAEFGRLCRALLQYSMEGTVPKLSGNEKVLIKRVLMQEDRFQQSYEDMKTVRSEAGKKGAATRWQGIDGDGKDSKAILPYGKNGNTDTNTNTNTNYSLSNESEARAREDEKPKNTRFKAPTTDEVRAYCAEKGYNMDAQAFVDHYESNGWRVGKSPMKSWQAAVRQWQSREAEFRSTGTTVKAKPGRGEGANGQLGSYEMQALRKLHGMIGGASDGD